MQQRTLIIAEAGVNHNGDLSTAKRLIEVATAAGADVVKFQTFRADRMVVPTAGKADYQSRTTDAQESQYGMLQRLELTEEMHAALIAHCAECNIRFLSTGFDIESVNFLANLGLDCFKIPSGEITNLPYLRHIGQFGKSILLSTGMSTMDEVEAAVVAIEKAGTTRDKVTVLHCTTEYPTPMEEVNLRAMVSMGNALGVRIGYSDHTQGIEVAVAAVAMGACVIEKHFTLDRNMPGPDHNASLEPAELLEMVKAIRNIEAAMGDGIKKPMPNEEGNKVVARKSLVASVAIKAGETFSPHNITAKRPAKGVSPMCWDAIMGLKARRDYLPNELIEL